MTEQLDLSDGDTQNTFSVDDLTTVDGDDARAAFARLVERADGPATIERITIVTPGRIPSSNPAFTEAAKANGIDPDRLSFVHPGDYVPALGSVSGPDRSPVPSARPNGYAPFRQIPQRVLAESQYEEHAPQEDTRLLAALYKEPGSDTPNAKGIVFTSVIAIVLVVVLFVLVTAFS